MRVIMPKVVQLVLLAQIVAVVMLVQLGALAQLQPVPPLQVVVAAPDVTGQTVAMYAAAAVVVIGAIFNGVVLVIAARRAGAVESATRETATTVSQTHATVAEIQVKTDGHLSTLTDQNKLLAEKLEQFAAGQLANALADRHALEVKLAAAEANIVQRADAAPSGTAPQHRGDVAIEAAPAPLPVKVEVVNQPLAITTDHNRDQK